MYLNRQSDLQSPPYYPVRLSGLSLPYRSPDRYPDQNRILS